VGTSGVVTLEDVLEEIVGEIEDEHDEAEPRMKQVAPMRYVVDASVSVYDFEEFMGYKLPGEGGDFDSIGGFLVNLAGPCSRRGRGAGCGGTTLYRAGIRREARSKD
jgi:CBS domain containing-hemolysin-like protein